MQQEGVFWFIALLALLLFFVVQGSSFLETFYFISFLMPIVIGTAYIFNQVLLPKYLMPQRYKKFTLYTVYLVIVSLYLLILVVFAAIMIFSLFQGRQAVLLNVNVMALSFGMYGLVLINAFMHIFQSYKVNLSELNEIEEQLSKNQVEQIIVRSNRQQVQIALSDLLFIESLGDYVQLHLTNEKVVTKEKISHLQSRLPEQFVRIHRSFIVNKNKVSTFSKDKLKVGDVELSISRTYRKEVGKLFE